MAAMSIRAEYRISDAAVNRPCVAAASKYAHMRIGTRIREIRKARGMRQHELAKRAGLSQTTISDLERGRNVSSTELPQLARALGVAVEELIHGKGVSPESSSYARESLLAVWDQLTPHQRTDEFRRLENLAKANQEIARHLAYLHLDRPVPNAEVAKHLPPVPAKPRRTVR